MRQKNCRYAGVDSGICIGCNKCGKVCPTGKKTNLKRKSPESVMGKGTEKWERASGTEILDELAEEEIATGHMIVYTSADSVLQICGNEETFGFS